MIGLLFRGLIGLACLLILAGFALPTWAPGSAMVFGFDDGFIAWCTLVLGLVALLGAFRGRADVSLGLGLVSILACGLAILVLVAYLQSYEYLTLAWDGSMPAISFDTPPSGKGFLSVSWERNGPQLYLPENLPGYLGIPELDYGPTRALLLFSVVLLLDVLVLLGVLVTLPFRKKPE